MIDLDGHFGMHPALAPMEAQWRDGTLAFVDACGSPDPTRSHFDAQDFMESGTPGVKSTHDGWLNRSLAAIPGTHGPTEALSLGATVPRILSGKMPVANIALGRAAARPMPLDRPVVEAAFDQMYDGNDALSRAYHEGRQARAPDQRTDAGYDGGQWRRAVAARIHRRRRPPRAADRRDPTIRIGFLALGGWDTHVSKGGATGSSRAI